MARVTEWRRWNIEFPGPTLEGSLHQVKLFTLAEGETLTRTRYRWSAQHTPTTAAEAVGFPVGVGIIAVPAGTLPGNVPGPLTSFDADWVGWEISFFYPFPVDLAATPTEVDMAPLDATERDTKAQRLAPAGGLDVWVCSETDSAQSTHYLTAGGSCLVLLPA